MNSTPYILPTSIIANAPGVNGWINPDNIFLVDGQYAVASGISNILEAGNFNLNIPQGSDITNFSVQVKGYIGSVAPNLQIYAVDDTSGVELSYPMAPFSGFSATNTLYTLPSTLFGTTWTVDQANNIKFRLICDGELYLDAILVSADYVPQTVPITPPPPSGLIVTDEFVEAQPFQLAQSMTATDLYMFLQSFNYPDGVTQIQYADFYGDACLVIDQGVPGREEQVVITNVEQDYQGTGLCRLSFGTLANRGLKFSYPYDSVPANIVSHFGTAEVVISNSAKFYSRFLRINQIGALVSAPITVDNQNTPLATPATELDFEGGGVTVVNDGTIASKKIITIPGSGTSQPIVVSTSSATTGASQEASLTWNHTASGINRTLTVQVETEAANTITGITFNGVALAQAVTANAGTIRNEEWYLTAPAVGTYPIVVTMSAPSYITAGAESWVSTNQSSPIGAIQTATGTGLSPSLTLTTTSDNSFVVDSLATGTLPIVYTVAAGQQLNWNVTANPNARQGASSLKPAGTAPDAVTMSWSITQSIPWVQTAIEIKGVPPASSGVTQIVAGTNVTISPSGGTGVVTINATGTGSSITLKTNGTNNGSQTVLNLAAGSGISLADNGSGTVTVTNTGSSGGGTIGAPGQELVLAGIGGNFTQMVKFGSYLISKDNFNEAKWYTSDSNTGAIVSISNPISSYNGFTVSSDGLTLYTISCFQGGGNVTITLQSYNQSLTLLNTATGSFTSTLPYSTNTIIPFAISGSNLLIQIAYDTANPNQFWKQITISGTTLSTSVTTNLQFQGTNVGGPYTPGCYGYWDGTNIFIQAANSGAPSPSVVEYSFASPNFTQIASSSQPMPNTANYDNQTALPFAGFTIPASGRIGWYRNTSLTDYTTSGGTIYYQQRVIYNVYTF